MIVVYLILLAVIQAVVEFLPVSSMGHLCALEQLMGINHGTGLLLEAILHLGTAAAIIFLSGTFGNVYGSYRESEYLYL